MMLDLHIWGPALGLPSIDPECLAIITYLHHALPSTAWRLIPSNDPSISPHCILPSLSHDGIWTSGFGPIVEYLTSKSLCKDLDAHLSSSQLADVVAYSAYLSTHAAPLLDLSLYVSAANWVGATRPAYSELLKFPLTWTVPPLIRAEAVKRSEHLGLAELDRDFDANGGLHLSDGRDALPETFRRHLPTTTKKTLTEEMTPEQAVAIRLYRLSENCLSTLESLLSEAKDTKETPKFFPGASISSLDCLAYGYLALMREPPVPRPFLKDFMVRAAPMVCKFIDHMKTMHHESASRVPWTTATEASTLQVTNRLLDTTIRSLPSLGEYYVGEARRRADEGIRGIDRSAFALVLSVLTTSAALGYGYFMYKSLLPFGRKTQVWTSHRATAGFGQMGQAGALLSSVFGAYQMPSPQHAAGSGGHGDASARIVESDSEVD
ncbi:putative metaxin [Stachybotrys elegans]|uniref:Metaxin n=1 Tax=Stachybotrys elegans TaxID=80388 RepID=A0A8K0SRL1_9HYPO|nr:putative metaxin [Stachybotrys elegans]